MLVKFFIKIYLIPKFMHLPHSNSLTFSAWLIHVNKVSDVLWNNLKEFEKLSILSVYHEVKNVPVVLKGHLKKTCVFNFYLVMIIFSRYILIIDFLLETVVDIMLYHLVTPSRIKK